MIRNNPLEWTGVNSAYPDACRVMAVVWHGSATAGDTVRLQKRGTSKVVWAGRASDTNNYIGLSLGMYGVPCPDGFELTQISSGTVIVYLAEL